LIIGLDPSLRTIENDSKITHVIARMKKSYYGACKSLIDDVDGSGFEVGDDEKIDVTVNPLKRRIPKDDELWSCEIEDIITEYQRKYVASGLPEEFEFCASDKHELSFEEIKRRHKLQLDSYFTGPYEAHKKIEHALCERAWYWSFNYVHEFDDQKFSREELRRWLLKSRINSQYAFAPLERLPVEKALSSKERSSLLIVIAALCDYSDIDHQARGVAQTIKKMTQDINSPLDDGTILKILKQIPDALKE